MMDLNSEAPAELNLDLTLGTTAEPRGFFLCVYCGRKFRSSQALGGHQNAHRLERKRRREINAATRAHTIVDSPAGNKVRRMETASAHKASPTTTPEYGVERAVDELELDLSLRL